MNEKFDNEPEGAYIPLQLTERLQEFLDRYEAEHSRTPLNAWLTGEIVMDVLEISERTLQTLRSEGRLPYTKVGQRIFYKRADVEQLFENGYSGNTTNHTTNTKNNYHHGRN